ncbi:MAG: polysaccharide biosynthesis C-terminal domain-containing protein, partial [Planctomycetes bacterium]|nr:polysaccharide biosynthesis C-terminal domain-containing protein [Planctomycetota bacterium]
MSPTSSLSPKRSTWQEAVRLSLPATLSLLLHAGYRVNDQFWIAPLGPDAQAAFGVTSFQLIFNFALIVLVQAGTLARIARHTGSGDKSARDKVFQTMVPVGFLWFVTIGIIGWVTTPYAATMLGASGDVHDLAVAYLRAIYAGLPFLALKPFTDGVFLGLGNTFTPMVLAGLSVALNFVLNPLLIFGYAGFPERGIAGAGVATCISRGLC